jgi:hypothetical protein
MRKFTYTSTHIEGEVIVAFNDETGWLVACDLSQANLTQDQHATFLRNFPLTLNDFKSFVEKDKDNRQLTEIIQNVTFEMFWEKYDYKTLSHKKKSFAKWEKMSEAERQKAFNFIAKYNHLVMKQSIGKKHAETYLNAELWNN